MDFDVILGGPKTHSDIHRYRDGQRGHTRRLGGRMALARSSIRFRAISSPSTPGKLSRKLERYASITFELGKPRPRNDWDERIGAHLE